MITETTRIGWRKRFGGLTPRQAPEPPQLQHEKARLKKVVAQRTLSAALALVVHAAPVRASDAASLPPGVQMLLPRGGIPAVFDPEFVTADEAGLPDSAWVLGVALGGEARAYSLNLLNGHEVVNDSIGGRPIAAVW